MTTTTEAPPEQADPEPASRVSPWVKAFVVLVIAAGIFFRFVTKSDMWLDEALTVNISHLSASRIPTWLRHDGAPPFFYLLLHYWMKVFGTSDLGARSLPGIFGVGSMPLAWYCGKRIGGRRTAWIAVMVFSINAYAIVYATSARMYSMEIFLSFAGILAVQRAFERPTVERVGLVGVLVAIMIYTQYWGFYLTAAFALFLLGTIRRSPQHRDAAVKQLIAVAVGLLTFIPWLPSFLYQAKHTGTPWGKPVLPPTPIGFTFQDFSGGQQQEGWILLLGLIVLVFLGVFGRARDSGHIEVDLHAQPGIRWHAAIAATALVIGTSATYLSRNAFQSRYSSIVFPFFVLIVARGITCFGDKRMRALIVVLIVGLGCVGGVRDVTSNRSSARKVAVVLKKEAKPGDVVLYCPDQVAPAVHRLIPHLKLDEVTYPKLRGPGLVDWVDYKAVLARHKPAKVAQQVLDRAGSHTIWYVSAPGYSTHQHSCDNLAAALGQTRPTILRINSDPNAFEKQGLKEFPAR